MDRRTAATLLAAGRVVIGTALFAAPRQVADGWLGEAGAAPATHFALRGLGARDAAIGLGALLANSTGRNDDHWIEAGIVADLGDAAGVLMARDGLPFRAWASTALIAGGAAALGLWIRMLADEVEPQPVR